jgi:C1A family cysteine protease
LGGLQDGGTPASLPVTLTPQLAPLSARFVASVSLGAAAPLQLAGPSRPLGYRPGPVDLSHLRGQRIATGLPPGALQAGFPQSYDLRTEGKLTAVRNQLDCGSCWTFAAYGSLESILLPTKSWDFSENHMKNTHGFDWGHCDGGNALLAAAYLTRLGGPVAESDDPYNPASNSSPTSPTLRRRIHEVLHLPGRAGPTDNDNIKQALMTHGAVMTSMHWTNAAYSSATTAYYHPTSTSSNHAVAIVGWDDGFSASKFAALPPGDGAFIIRNSWSSLWGDGGYFHISYHDAVVGLKNWVFSGAVDPQKPLLKVYQHDPLGWVTSVGYNGATAWMANVFAAQTDEQLEAVGFYTTGLDTAYTVQIYNGITSSPVGAKLLGSASGTIASAGYHTVTLTAPGAALTSGEPFSVVVKLSTPGVNYPLAIELPYANYSSQATASAGQSYISSNGATWTDLTSAFPNTNVCLKAFTRPGCDDDNTCTVDAWDGTGCTHTPAPAGTLCRAAAGPCDTAESCSGTSGQCPVDAFKPAAALCRAAAGACDAAESCSGSSAACPADALEPAATVCRAAAGDCDEAESCSGTSATCPADAFKSDTSICRASVGDCDVAESCTGTAAVCPADTFKPSSTVCRSATGPCDVAESCSGTAGQCPTDTFKPSSTVCRSATGPCDVAESCSGTAAVCPTDTFKPSSTVCRSATGPCDVAESCSGSAGQCPTDTFKPSSTVCRKTTGPCDVAESCSGTAAVCPADAFKSSSTVCRSTTGPCDVAESCTGTVAVCPADAFKSTSTVCRSAVGACDVAESCSGSAGQCPADAFKSSSTVCRSAVGACDL